MAATRPSHPDPGRDGFVQRWSSVLAAALSWLRARLALAGFEWREAGRHYFLALGFGLLALLALKLVYLFLCFAIIFAIAAPFDSDVAWIWVTLGMGVLHLAAGFAAWRWACGKAAQPMFPVTLDELRKDQVWLQTKPQRQS